MYLRAGQIEPPAQQPLRIPLPFLQQQTGLGDFLKAATMKMGIQPCLPCQKRAEALNRRIVLRPW